MPIKYSDHRTTVAAKTKVAVAGLAGIASLILFGSVVNWKAAPLIGWDVAALVFFVWTWATIWNLDANLTSKHAVREDPSRVGADAVVVVASLASLGALAVVLLGAGNTSGTGKILSVLLGVFSVVLAWATVHTVFALRYAELYYSEHPGGIDFPHDNRPCYRDFAYVAFTIGMTFQVSDTGFQSTDFRTVALRHSLIAYIFGTVIVATTINLIAGLTK
jgi:uncharacterized membrane protein